MLDSLTAPINTRTRVHYYIDLLIGMPGLLAATWRSFEEQNAVAQPACASAPRRGMIVLAWNRPGTARPAAVSVAEWASACSTRYPNAVAAVKMSGPGMAGDGSQLLLVLQVVVADGQQRVYRALLDQSRPDDGWTLAKLIEENLDE